MSQPTKLEELARRIRHKHRWSRKYEGIFNWLALLFGKKLELL